MYICLCGKSFEKANSFNAHKSHCKIHLTNKYGNTLLFDSRKNQVKNSLLEGGKSTSKKFKELQEKDLINWISEQHKCEKCGKIMTEKFGSGRFCCRACANTRSQSNETKEKTSKSLKNYYIENPINQEALNIRLTNLKKAHLAVKAKAKPRIFGQCAWCGKLIDITSKKNKRQYCDGTCRNQHLNSLREIGSQGMISKWETEFQQLLIENNIKFEANKRDLIPSKLEIDIWIPDHNIAIELNGIWHYSQKPYGKDIAKYNRRLEKDKIKEKEVLELGYQYFVFEDRYIKDTHKFFTDFIQKYLVK